MKTTPQDSSAKLRSAVERSSRRSAARAAAFLGIALISAVAAVAFFLRYVDQQISTAKVPTTKVVVAKVDIARGTSLLPEMLELVDWPAATQPDGVFANTKDLASRVAAVKIFKGEPVLEGRLAAKGAGGGLSAVLPAGSLAVSVRVDDVVGVAGFIHPGDSVDVIVTMKPRPSGDALPVSKIVLQNIPVIAVGQQLERGKSGASRRGGPAITVATLLVTPDQAEYLALSASQGKILLGLRSSFDEELVQTKGVVAPDMLSGRKAATASPKPAPQKMQDIVEILRGDLLERRKFQ